MTNRDIFRASLNHKNAGAIPVDFGATAVSSMHVTCVDALRRHYGLERRPAKVCEPFQMLGLIEDDLKEAMGVTVCGVPSRASMFGFPLEGEYKEFRLDNGLEVLVPAMFNVTRNERGDAYIYPQGDLSAPPSGRMPKDGYYFDAIIRQPPILDDDALCADDNLEEFVPISAGDLAFHAEALSRLAAQGVGVIDGVGGTAIGDIALIPGMGLRHPKGIRDVEEWYVSTVSRKALLHEIFERQTDIAIENLKAYTAACPELPDALFVCGTDFGTQTGTFCSKAAFRELYMPYYKKMNDWVHENTSIKTFKHSCGAVASFIPLFIEAGFDIINPVQCSCAGMEPEALKREFGADIVFWGGGVDTQKTLPFGTPEQVRDEVLARCEIFGKDGGYVFNAIHNVQARTPVENIAAMLSAVREFNGR